MSRTVAAGVLVGAACVAVACVAAWWFRPSAGGPAGAGATLVEPPRRPLPTPPAEGEAPSPAEPQPPAPSLERLRELCGQPSLGAFGPECLDALEQRYGTVPAVADLRHFYTAPVFDPVLLGRPPTWDDVFQDTEGALARVYDAMDRPECLPPEGELRFEHREACAADDMARLAILRLDCARLMFRLGYSGEVDIGVWEGQPGDRDDFEERQRHWESHLLRLDRAADTADYRTRRDRMDGEWYAAMWRAGKCRALPIGVFTKLGPFGTVTGWPQIGPSQRLFETAARLGSEWALSVVLNKSYEEALPLDERSLAELQTERPALAELLRLRRTYLRDWWNPARHRVTILMHAAAALAIGEAVNANIHADAVWGPAKRFFPDGADEPDRATGVTLAARRLIGMGWTVVVSGGEEGEAERVFTRADEVYEGDPWWAWWDAGRVSAQRS